MFIADIDRTYLATHFSSLKGLARIPFERAADKEDIAGMARLFREIRRGPARESRETPLYFVSASPSQLRPVIERKMVLDGIGFDGTTFKDWTGVLRKMRLGRLREQIGFKLTAFYASRSGLPVGAHEVLIGDDLETDPLTFALYADSLASRINIDELENVLMKNGVSQSDAQDIARQRREIPTGRGVRQAFIRLERHRDPDFFREFGPGVLACAGAFQMAVALWWHGSVSAQGVVRVASDLVQRGVSIDDLRDRLHDLVRRAIVQPAGANQLADTLSRHGLIEGWSNPPKPDPAWQAVFRRDPLEAWTPARFLIEH